MERLRGMVRGRSKIVESRRGGQVGEQGLDDDDWIGYREVQILFYR